MKMIQAMMLAGLLILAGANMVTARQVIPVDKGWRFVREDVAEAAKPAYNDQAWKAVSIPHSWGWEEADKGEKYYRGPAWYRVTVDGPTIATGQRVFLWFGAVSSVADIYLNGQRLGQHRGGFSAFCYEVTSVIKPGVPNILAVRASNGKFDDVAPLGGDFNLYGGIYRPVRVIVTSAVCVSPLDNGSSGLTVFQKNVSEERAELEARVELSCAGAGGEAVQLHLTVQDASGKAVAEATQDAKVSAQPVSLSLAVGKPHLWDGVKDPYLYKVVAEVVKGDGTVLDRVEQPLGLRYFHVDQEKGFFLNGKLYPVHGANRHQEWFGKGWSLSSTDFEQDVVTLREMGATAVRLCHYQHSGEFLDVCDRAGLLVWSEVAAVGGFGKTPEFEANVRQQLTEMIRQHINHPSVFVWSLYNEQHNSPVFAAALGRLNELAHREDPTRSTIAATCRDNAPAINKVTDELGWNRYPGWYKGDAPGKLFDQCKGTSHGGGYALSEFGAGASVIQHEDPPKHAAPKSKWHPEEWQAKVHEEILAAAAARPYIWGLFPWVMFDFASSGRNEGDHPGRNDKGLVTADRLVKKDAFYFFKANWSDEPMVYITSRRFVERDQPKVGVKVYSNTDVVALKVNGVSLGTSKPNELHIATWAGVDLKMGENRIEVEGTRAGIKITDSCVWQRVTPKPAAVRPEEPPSSPSQKSADEN